MLPAFQKNRLVVQPAPLLFWLYYEPVIKVNTCERDYWTSDMRELRFMLGNMPDVVWAGSGWFIQPDYWKIPDQWYHCWGNTYRGSCSLRTGSIRSLPGANHQYECVTPGALLSNYSRNRVLFYYQTLLFGSGEMLIRPAHLRGVSPPATVATPKIQ